MNEWISVEDKTPTNDDPVLASWVHCKRVIVAYWCGNKWRPCWDTSLSLIDRPPTHWQPLPDLPVLEDSGPFYVDQKDEESINDYSQVLYKDGGFVCITETSEEGRGICERLNAFWKMAIMVREERR